jgi:hypothetical protein
MNVLKTLYVLDLSYDSILFDIDAPKRFFAPVHISCGFNAFLQQVKKLVAVLNVVFFVVRRAKRHFGDRFPLPIYGGDDAYQRLPATALFFLGHCIRFLLVATGEAMNAAGSAAGGVQN